MNISRERSYLISLLHTPTKEQRREAGRALPAIVRALATYKASDDYEERREISSGVLFPLLHKSQTLFRSLAEAELCAVRVVGRMAMTPFLSSQTMRELIVSKFDREIRMRLFLNLALVEFSCEYYAEAAADILAAAIATRPRRVRAFLARFLRNVATRMQPPCPAIVFRADHEI